MRRRKLTPTIARAAPWTAIRAGHQRPRVLEQHIDHRFAARLREPPCAVIEPFDDEPAFVHRAMMKPAERHQVRKLGLATIGPVPDVMPIDVACVSATREATAFVA